MLALRAKSDGAKVWIAGFLRDGMAIEAFAATRAGGIMNILRSVGRCEAIIYLIN